MSNVFLDALKKNSLCQAPYLFIKSTTTGVYLGSQTGVNVHVANTVPVDVSISNLFEVTLPSAIGSKNVLILGNVYNPFALIVVEL